MFKKVLRTLRGIFFMTLIAIWMVIISLFVLICAGFVFIIPWKKWRHQGMKFLLELPVWWMDLNHIILQANSRKKLDMYGSDPLKPKGWYLMISNHRSWLDILIIGIFFNRKIPLLKFFMKKELLWTLPIAGVDCYILGYPFMERHSPSEIRRNPDLRNKDIQTTKRSCEKFKHFPTTVINFVEGSRFREYRKLTQHSPYKNLLRPKAGGIAIVLKEMAEHLEGIINVTIYYEPHDISIWEFVCGNFEKIHIRYEVLPVTEDLIGNYYEDRKFRIHFQKWLNDLWKKKDDVIEELKSQK